MTWDEHDGIELANISASVLIISDSLFSGEKDISEDQSGALAIDMLSDFGFESINLDYYPDEQPAIESKIENDVADKNGLILLVGGTGIAHRDVTVDALKNVVTKELPGFGEEFRRRSYDQVQEMAFLSRSMAGIKNESLIIALPGSSKAVKLGIELVGAMIKHIMQLLRR